jgi:hypothetical protein
MPYTTYRSLPLEALYDLLIISVVDLLAAMDSKKGETAIQPLRTQIEAIIGLIGEKKNRQFNN